MGVTSGYWQMWHLYSSGVVYCALGMPHVECTGMRWRELHPHLPVRDRYAQSKILQATVAFMEVRGEIPVLPGADRMRLLYSRYLPWSAQHRTRPLQAGQAAENQPEIRAAAVA